MEFVVKLVARGSEHHWLTDVAIESRGLVGYEHISPEDIKTEEEGVDKPLG